MFRKTALVAIVLLLSVACAFAADKPNFVLIFADDLGYGDLAVYGHPSNQTPRLDRMAAEGIRFTDFYVPMPYCAPSRATILTGRYPFRHGVVRNPTPDRGINDYGLPDSEVTLAQALKSRGYATTCIGKWHLGHIPEYLPVRRGFDSYFGILYSNDMRPVQLVENERVVEYPVVQGTLTRRYTERALSFIEQNKKKPFFLYLPHAMPHKPLAASEDFYTPETPGDLYADVMRELDWSVGRILDKLAELKLDKNTLVIFTSDNGPWYGGSAGRLRGMKGRSWEGGVRVPMIAWWPARIPGGQVTGEIAATIDIFPTVCKLAGAAPPSGKTIDGKDLMPLLTAPGTASPHEAIYAMSGAELHFIRSGKWKLHVRSPGSSWWGFHRENSVAWVDPRAPDGVTIVAQTEQYSPNHYPGAHGGVEGKAMMLFDLEADPSEQRDVAAAHPDVVSRLKAVFDKIDAQAQDVPPPPKVLFDTMQHLKGGELRYDRIIGK